MCPFVCARACFLCLLSWSLLTNTFLGSWLPIASSIREDCRLGIHVSDSFARQAIVVSYFLHGHNVLYQKYLKICYLLIHCGIYCPKVWYIVYNIYLCIHTIQWIYCISCRYHDESVSVGQEILANGLKWVWLDAAWHLRIAAYRSACSCSSCNESTRSWRLDGWCSASVQRQQCAEGATWQGVKQPGCKCSTPNTPSIFLFKVQGWETIDHHGQQVTITIHNYLLPSTALPQPAPERMLSTLSAACTYFPDRMKIGHRPSAVSGCPKLRRMT